MKKADSRVFMPHSDLDLKLGFQAIQYAFSEGKAPISVYAQAYGAYKQATLGDCVDPQPSVQDHTDVQNVLVKTLEWREWKNLSGQTQTQAMSAFFAVKDRFDAPRKLNMVKSSTMHF